MSVRLKKIWLLTDRGVSLTKKCVALFGLGAFCSEVFPHTILLPFKRESQEQIMKERTGSTELPHEVRQYVRRALDDMKFTEDQRKALTVHLADADDTFTYGNVNSVFGSQVKLPWAMWNKYKIPTSVQGDDGTHPGATQQYFDSMKWSEKAKLYLTAYQLAWTRKYLFAYQGLFNAGAISMAFITCYLYSSSDIPFNRNPQSLVRINMILGLLFFISYIVTTDSTTCEYEEEIIKEVCELGKEYAEGAVELYTKLRDHNLAIRELMGFVGRVKCDEDGNTRSLRRSNVTVTERIAIAQKVLGSYEDNNGSVLETDTGEKKSINKKVVL